MRFAEKLFIGAFICVLAIAILYVAVGFGGQTDRDGGLNIENKHQEAHTVEIFINGTMVREFSVESGTSIERERFFDGVGVHNVTVKAVGKSYSTELRTGRMESGEFYGESLLITITEDERLTISVV